MNTPKIEQWMQDAAKDFYGDSYVPGPGVIILSDIIAKHAPAQPAELPSIWKPVAIAPTKEDGDEFGRVIAANARGPWLHQIALLYGSDATHWCSIADFKARCPLPKVKTQEELDEEWIKQQKKDGTPFSLWDVKAAIAYGRATANTEEGK